MGRLRRGFRPRPVIVAGEQRAGRIAPPRRQAVAAVARVSGLRHPHLSAAAGQRRGAMRAGRCGSSKSPQACLRCAAKTCRPGACLTIPAFAGVRRPPCPDQGQQRGWPVRRWRIPANADGTACGAVFDLARREFVSGEPRSGRIAPPGRQAFAAQHPRASAAAGQGRGAVRAGRCVSSEKPPAGVFLGGGAALVPGVADHLVIQPIPYRPANHPNRSRQRKASAGRRFFRP